MSGLTLFTFIIFITLCLLTAVGQVYLATVAGTGVFSSTGDGGPATSATINSPGGIWSDSNGNSYIGDINGAKIRKIDSSGIISTIIGNGISSTNGNGGAATSVSVYGGAGIYGDPTRNVLYFSDGAYFVWRHDLSSGIVSRYAGAVPASQSYSGDGGAATSATLHNPFGLFVSSTGILYIAVIWNHRVRAINPDTGIITTFAGNGTAGYTGDSKPASSTALYNPHGVWGTTDGRIYIADYNNNRIRRVGSVGIMTTFAGTGHASSTGDNGPVSLATIYNPIDAKGDSLGQIYLAEYTGHQVRVVSTTGIITSLVGTTGNLRALFLDSKGKLYLSEGAYVRSVEYTPTATNDDAEHKSKCESNRGAKCHTNFRTIVDTNTTSYSLVKS